MSLYKMFDSGFNSSQISENWLHSFLTDYIGVEYFANYFMSEENCTWFCFLPTTQREQNGCLLILIDNVNLIQI